MKPLCQTLERFRMMMIDVKVVVFVAIFYFSSSTLTNAEDLKRESPFRLQKHNLLWDHANKNLGSSPKLDTLFKQLKKLDKLSLKLKHLENRETEDARMMEADVKEMYLDISNSYGLDTNEADNEGHNHIKAKFGDKVEKLWQKALDSGKFSSEELDSLEKEFKHHEKKIEDYRQMAEKIISHDAISENDIRSIDKMPESDIKKLRQDLKLKHHHISANFLDLTKKVKDRVYDVEGDFTDMRVVELWEQAKRSGFSQDELESMKRELKHFQTRIDKHNYWKDRHASWKDDLNNGDVPEPGYYEKVQAKVNEHARLVKKYHATMLDMIHGKDEL